VKKTVVITQPTYFPWLGYFEQVARSDVLVFLDTVQFERRSWQCRNRLKGVDDEPFWLTVPLMAHSQKTLINEIRVSRDQSGWRRQHLTSIQKSLGTAPYFNSVFPLVTSLINAETEFLADLNISIIKAIAELLGLSRTFMRASELKPDGKRTALLVDISMKLGANVYYSAAGSKIYLEEEKYLFQEAGIDVKYQDWNHPEYLQCSGKFVSHMSVLDPLMNIGPEGTRALIG